MNGARCARCKQFWSFMGNPELFEIIHKVCPNCMPLVCPRIAWTVDTIGVKP